MNIYCFRHGEALSGTDPAVKSDPERPLIDDGIRKTRQAAEGLLKMGIVFDAVLTSPWLRAKQTAEIVCEVLAIPKLLQEMPQLAGDESVENAIAALARMSPYQDVMLVGHNPLLSELAAQFLTLSTGMKVDLKKSGVCAIEVERIPSKKPGTLLWMMTSKQLRAMR